MRQTIVSVIEVISDPVNRSQIEKTKTTKKESKKKPRNVRNFNEAIHAKPGKISKLAEVEANPVKKIRVLFIYMLKDQTWILLMNRHAFCSMVTEKKQHGESRPRLLVFMDV